MDLGYNSVDRLIQQILLGKAQSPQGALPSRMDFANAGAPPAPPDTSRAGSTIDFANVPPPDIPQALLNPIPTPTPRPDPMTTGGIPTPTPNPQRQMLAQMMPKPPMGGPMMSQRGESAGYTTSGTDRSKGAGMGSSARGRGGLY
jgi:hypothetical protein